MAAPAPIVRREYLITGNYGTFELSKVVVLEGNAAWTDDEWEDEVWQETGIMTDLEEAGWDFDEGGPEGEQWEIERIV